ncbi:hypothetical protein [Candidatus Pelagibacter ubique]|uniref:hypothetical protein n=1 Tax=Pelagibacter ubique TaxID=198252 RepID=UPI0003C7E8A1
MKKLFYITFFLSVLLSSNNFANANDYSICATNADGAILVKEEDGDNTSFALASSPTDFSHANSSDPDRGGYCEVTPDNYKLKMFKMGLCTEDPYRIPDSGSGNTIGADLTSCISIFDNSTGSDVNIQPGVEVDLLTGGFTIPIGVYPFTFALIDNVIQIKHIQEYAAATGGDANFVIRGYDPDNNDGSTGTGKVCYTGLNSADKKFVFTTNQERQSAGFTTLRGYTLPTNFTGKQPSAGFHCGTMSEAIAENDWAISIVDNFGDRMAIGQDGDGLPTSRVASNFRNAARQDRGFHLDFPTIRQAYYLYNSSDTPATSSSAVEKILFIQDDTNNIVSITENTIGFKLNFKTNNSIEMAVYEEAGANDQVLQATAVNGNTIFVNVQTKTKRRRGAWR